ncbi:MAG: TetR/AcrR family transcriptional regulator [Lacisediminihabitans sp.]
MKVVRDTRRDELVRVAISVLERDGLEKFSIGEIARDAGIKPPSLYKQFVNKADIEAAMVELGLREQATVNSSAIAALGESASKSQIAETIVRAFRDFGTQHPQLYRLMNDRPLPATLPPGAMDAISADYRKLFTNPSLATSFWAWAHGLLSLELAGRYESQSDVEELWKVMVGRLVAEVE